MRSVPVSRLLAIAAVLFTAVLISYPTISATSASGQNSAPVVAGLADAHRQTLDRYCVTCHNERRPTPAGAPLVLDKSNLAQVGDDAEAWEKVLRKLRTRTMPPAGMPRPDEATYESVADWLEGELDKRAATHANPGRPAAHRLNRAEYANAIRDLLAVDVDVRGLLPPDDSGYGFDNIADVLTVSPTLLERYMVAAGRISKLAVGDPRAQPVVDHYSLSRMLPQGDRMSDELPFGSRGGIAVRHAFPADAVYTVRVRLQRDTVFDAVKGMGRISTLEVRLDGEKVGVFTVGGAVRTDDGLVLDLPVKHGTRTVGVAFVKSGIVSEGARRPPLIGFGRDFDLFADEDPSVERVEVGGPFPVHPLAMLLMSHGDEAASRRRVFVCQPRNVADEEPCARKILSTLARRAYRRPVTPQALQPLLTFFRTGRARNGSFDGGIEMALRMLLVTPDFLFRVERDPSGIKAGTPYALDDIALASRLSFFLWSSLPDDELLDLAARGQLSKPDVLEHQVARMLKDGRSAALISNFAGQWLLLRNLNLAVPNTDLFPVFDEGLRSAFRRETELFFESIVREDRSVLDFLTANYTFLNERLARHYGVPNVYGSRFRRVTLADGHTRGGLLSHGSLLTVTSYANRTSPVQRGKWVLENVLGTPPPPPPPDVPSLPEPTGNAAPQSMRQRMEEHRKNPVCASCHARMDPIGFALERFDAIGAWREDDNGAAIDASGALPDGATFDGPSGLRAALLTHREEFVTTLVERLLTYSTGRGMEYYDQPAIRRVVREAAASNYRWSSLIEGVVRSMPFRMKRSQS